MNHIFLLHHQFSFLKKKICEKKGKVFFMFHCVLPSPIIMPVDGGDQPVLVVLYTIYIDCNYFSSTAVERVVACALVPGFDPLSGQVSWVRFFRGFSSPVRQMSGNFRPPKVPEYHLAVVIIIPYSPCWDD